MARHALQSPPYRVAAAVASLALSVALIPTRHADAASAATPDAGAVPTTATLHMMSKDESTLFGARCSDGSPYGFYVSQPPAAQNSTKWVIYLRGGGFCGTPATCEARLKTDLGTSSVWKHTYTLDGILSADPTVNPDFGAWNKVIMPYCTGDLHSGQQWTTTFGKYYFSGHLNIQRALTVLDNKFGFGDATEVLLSGSSAGGLGTLVHADWLTDLLKPRGVRVAANPMAGWFMDVPTFMNQTIPVGGGLNVLFEEWGSFVDASCNASRTQGSDPGHCFLGEYLLPFLETPTFVTEALYDIQQLYKEDGLPTSNFSAPVCAYIESFGDRMRASLQAVAQTKGMGVFACSCMTHGVDFTAVKVGSAGSTWQSGLGDWYFGRSQSGANVIESCAAVAAVPCNPTCGPTYLGKCAAAGGGGAGVPV